MIRRDYIMDQIQMFSAALARVIFNKDIKNYDQAQDEIDDMLTGMFRLDPNQVRVMADQELVALLRTGKTTDAEKMLILAEVLTEEADIRERRTGFDDTVYAMYGKAFCLYSEAFIIDAKLLRTEYLARTELIVPILLEKEPPLHIKYYLFRYYEGINNLAGAEDTLYELIEQGYPDVLQAGRAFYLRILQKSDTELANGNLPRNEVHDGLELIEKKIQAQ